MPVAEARVRVRHFGQADLTPHTEGFVASQPWSRLDHFIRALLARLDDVFAIIRCARLRSIEDRAGTGTARSQTRWRNNSRPLRTSDDSEPAAENRSLSAVMARVDRTHAECRLIGQKPPSTSSTRSKDPFGQPRSIELAWWTWIPRPTRPAVSWRTAVRRPRSRGSPASGFRVAAGTPVHNPEHGRASRGAAAISPIRSSLRRTSEGFVIGRRSRSSAATLGAIEQSPHVSDLPQARFDTAFVARCRRSPDILPPRFQDAGAQVASWSRGSIVTLCAIDRAAADG
jgi:hypothetical protein